MCLGTVVHHRRQPAEHHFTYPVNLLWLDPDRPGELDGRHPLCSARRPAPLWFRRTDYLDGAPGPLGPAVRRHLAEPLGHWPDGPLRMLTQPRTWGWLFNPITIYLAWPDPDGAESDGADPAGPVAALLEVTNTPWKERHLYAVALHPDPVSPGAREAHFDKVLHVSPFLGEDFGYRLGVRFAATGPGLRRLTVDLDVLPGHRPPPGPHPGPGLRIQPRRGNEQPGEALCGQPVLTTRLVVDQHPLERAMLTQSLRRNPLPTHRVSLGIHRQALALWRRRVPFVPHPARRPEPAPAGAATREDRP